MNYPVYPTVMVMDKKDYPDRQEYLQAFHDCDNHYPYKARFSGGWVFFMFKVSYKQFKKNRKDYHP